jgi:hydrogenase 3 maturation protease
VVVLGVGSELRGDDVAGIIAASVIEKRTSGNKDIKVLFGTTAPENYTGEIKKHLPTHIIIIDAAELGKKPGEVGIIEEADIGGVSFSTHMLPTRMVIDYLRMFLSSEIITVGIQPERLEFDSKPTETVRKAAEALGEFISESLICATLSQEK